MKIIKYTGKGAEVVPLLGGLMVEPNQKVALAEKLAGKLLSTKRWKKETMRKEMIKNDC
jgi:hypothetical protein